MFQVYDFIPSVALTNGSLQSERTRDAFRATISKTATRDFTSLNTFSLTTADPTPGQIRGSLPPAPGQRDSPPLYLKRQGNETVRHFTSSPRARRQSDALPPAPGQWDSPPLYLQPQGNETVRYFTSSPRATRQSATLPPAPGQRDSPPLYLQRQGNETVRRLTSSPRATRQSAALPPAPGQRDSLTATLPPANVRIPPSVCLILGTALQYVTLPAASE